MIDRRSISVPQARRPTSVPVQRRFWNHHGERGETHTQRPTPNSSRHAETISRERATATGYRC